MQDAFATRAFGLKAEQKSTKRKVLIYVVYHLSQNKGYVQGQGVFANNGIQRISRKVRAHVPNLNKYIALKHNHKKHIYCAYQYEFTLACQTAKLELKLIIRSR